MTPQSDKHIDKTSTGDAARAAWKKSMEIRNQTGEWARLASDPVTLKGIGTGNNTKGVVLVQCEVCGYVGPFVAAQ
jgi:hypothetical protein